MNQNHLSMMGLTSHLFLSFQRFFFLSRFFFFDLLELVSFDELDFPGESDNDGSRSGSYGMSVCSSGEYVGSVSAVGFGKKFPLESNHLVTLFSW